MPSVHADLKTAQDRLVEITLAIVDELDGWEDLADEQFELYRAIQRAMNNGKLDIEVDDAPAQAWFFKAMHAARPDLRIDVTPEG